MHIHMTGKVDGMESLCMWVHCSQRPWDRIKFPEAGVRAIPWSCVSHSDVDAKNCESSARAASALKHSFLPNSLVSNFKQRNDL